jgi:DNA-directed RNA polymerase subunit RPC12/RpoP
VELLVILFFFGLSAGVIGKIKGSSFLLWFLIGFCLPFVGTLAAVLYRFERREPRRRCPECGKVVALEDQVCMRCGRDLDFPRDVAQNPA